MVTLIAYPVYSVKALPSSLWELTKDDFFRSAGAIARQFGILGRSSIGVTSNFKLSFPIEGIRAAWVYSLPGIGGVAVFEWKSGYLSARQIDQLSRPNHQATEQLLNSLGLIPMALTVTKTISAVVSPKSKMLNTDGHQVLVPTTESEFFTIEVISRILASIVIERMILDDATEYLSRGPHWSAQARRHVGRIHGWISNPPIENPNVRKIYAGLRDALNLDERGAELREALEAISRRGNDSLVAGIAVSAIGVALAGTPYSTINKEWIFLIGGLVAGFIAWAIARGTR
jgi:hypothetical protein